MSPPRPLARRIVDHAGRPAVLATVAAVALAGVALLTLLDRSAKPQGAASLRVEASARNASRDGTRFGRSADAAAGNLVEYSLKAVNDGRAELSDVAIAFTAPPAWGASLNRGSCRLRRPGDDFVACPDRLRRNDLSAERLGPGESLEVRVRYTVDRPPCRTPSVPGSATADSAQTAVTEPATTAVRYTGTPAAAVPRCGTPLAQLLSAVPPRTRPTCTEWPGLGRPVLARVSCLPKQGVRFAVYLQYRSPAVAAQVYELIASRDRPEPCGSFEDGEGSIQRSGARHEVTCSAGSGGRAHLTWYDGAAGVFGYADGETADLDGLLAWWRTNG